MKTEIALINGRIKRMDDYDIHKIEDDKRLITEAENHFKKPIRSVNEDFCKMIYDFLMFVNDNREFSFREVHVDYTDKDKIVIRLGQKVHNCYSVEFSWYRGKCEYSDVFVPNVYMGKQMIAFVYSVVSLEFKE